MKPKLFWELDGYCLYCGRNLSKFPDHRVIFSKDGKYVTCSIVMEISGEF